VHLIPDDFKQWAEPADCLSIGYVVAFHGWKLEGAQISLVTKENGRIGAECEPSNALAVQVPAISPG
jgi:hypothetical protein